MTRYCHPPCASLQPVNRYPSLPRETRVIRPEEECCPACGGELSSLGCDVSEQLELISSAFKVIETQRPKLACCLGATISCRHQYLQNPLHAVMPERGSRPCRHRKICRPSAVIPPVRDIPPSGCGAEPCHTGTLDRCCC
nr:IS66 family transposase zinc-finger binding domain-containing protein [Escherichia coli]